MFKEAKTFYVAASSAFVKLMKVTADDANFQAWCKQQVGYTLNRAEKCQANVDTQLMGKVQAGYGG